MTGKGKNAAKSGKHRHHGDRHPAESGTQQRSGKKKAGPKSSVKKHSGPKGSVKKHSGTKGSVRKESAKKDSAKKDSDRRAQLAQAAVSAESVPAVTAEVWLDPASASGFATLAWLSQAATVRPVRLTLHVVSESVADDGRQVSEERRRWLDSAWAPVRVAYAVQRNYGQEQLHSFLVALGMRIHALGEPISWESIEGALTAVGLPAHMAQLGYTGDNDDELRRVHFEAVAASGEPTPVTALLLDGVGWAAPEWQQLPAGEAAGVALDAIGELGRVSGLISLRRRPLG